MPPRLDLNPTHIESRVSSLETSVGNLHEDLSGVKLELKNIATILGAKNKTDWSIILTAGILILGFYAAAIRPMSADIDRESLNAEKLALAVLEQNKVSNGIDHHQGIDETNFTNLKNDVERLDRVGPALTDNRLSVIEEKMGLPNRSAMERVP